MWTRSQLCPQGAVTGRGRRAHPRDGHVHRNGCGSPRVSQKDTGGLTTASRLANALKQGAGDLLAPPGVPLSAVAGRTGGHSRHERGSFVTRGGGPTGSPEPCPLAWPVGALLPGEGGSSGVTLPRAVEGVTQKAHGRCPVPRSAPPLPKRRHAPCRGRCPYSEPRAPRSGRQVPGAWQPRPCPQQGMALRARAGGWSPRPGIGAVIRSARSWETFPPLLPQPPKMRTRQGAVCKPGGGLPPDTRAAAPGSWTPGLQNHDEEMFALWPPPGTTP